MARILWQSWSKECAEFDFIRISKLSLQHEWINGHLIEPTSDDILLTGNGYNHIDKKCFKATLYAEPYIYLKHEYDNFPTDTRWDLRFVYNRNLLHHQNTKLIPVAGYWDYDNKNQYHTDRHKTFGMALGHKPPTSHTSDIGYIRSEFVSALQGHSFDYWGPGWSKTDPNYRGEIYFTNNKFLDSQKLLSNCKFALAFDNSSINGYLTEKFWNSLAAGCIPIYFGDKSIKEIIPNDIFIYGYDFESIADIIKYCETMTNTEWKRKSEAGFSFFINDKQHSWEAIFIKIDQFIKDAIQK